MNSSPTTRSSEPPRHATSGFTLIELMVVVGIIVLLVSITLPAIGPMLASNQQAQCANTLSGLLINAQALTSQTATCIGLRIERAFKTSDLGLMLDINGNPAAISGQAPAWLDHQQVRFVTLAAYKKQIFSQTKDTAVQKLPKEYWLAPDYAFNYASLADSALKFNPQDTNTGITFNKIELNRLENFYIVFSTDGELVLYPASNILYADQTLQYFPSAGDLATPSIQHLDSSARAVIVYDRRQWKELAPEDSDGRVDVLRRAQPINISRVTGAIVEEAKK